MLLLVLLACSGKPTTDDGTVIGSIDDTAADTTDDTTDTSPPEDLGDPYLAMVAAVPPGFLQSTCHLRLDVFEGGEATDGEEIVASGGEWVGLQLQGGQAYTASGVYTDCTELNPSGTVDSGAFSGVAGMIFLFWYNGANAGYTTLVQTEDFSGGIAEVTLDDGADTAGIEGIAAELGVTLTLREGTTYDAAFATELPVAQVLAAFSRDAAFAEGSPAWIDAPYWW